MGEAIATIGALTTGYAVHFTRGNEMELVKGKTVLARQPIPPAGPRYFDAVLTFMEEHIPYQAPEGFVMSTNEGAIVVDLDTREYVHFADDGHIINSVPMAEGWQGLKKLVNACNNEYV